MDNSTIDCALSYAERGWYVIPLHSIIGGKCSCGRDCKSPGKHPRFSKWQSKASIDPNQIKAWWKKYPTANVGIVTGQQSGLVVIDIDPRNGGDDSLQNLIDSYPEFKPILTTHEVTTGGNGTHYYYAIDGPFKSLKRHGLGEGIDIKADGGYILAPPSNHVSGGVYAVVNDRQPLMLPPILNDLITQSTSSPEQTEIIEGNRNNWLAEQAGIQLRQGKTQKQVEMYLHEQNALYCRPPLEYGEVLSIARSMSSGYKPEASQKSIKTRWQEMIVESGFGPGFTHALIGLSLWMDADGRNCWPTEEQIEERLNMTRKTLRGHFQTAERVGYLVRFKKDRRGKQGWHYGYVAKIPQ